MRLHETRQINRPIAEVFAYTADFSNSEEWDPGVASAHRLDEGPLGQGSEFALMVRFGSRTSPMTYRITAYEPNSRVVLEGEGESIRAVDEIRFAAHDLGTLVEYTADLRFTNWLRWVAPVLRPMLDRVGERAVDGLVETLEP